MSTRQIFFVFFSLNLLRREFGNFGIGTILKSQPQTGHTRFEDLGTSVGEIVCYSASLFEHTEHTELAEHNEQTMGMLSLLSLMRIMSTMSMLSMLSLPVLRTLSMLRKCWR